MYSQIITLCCNIPQLAGGLLSGRYRMEEMDKPSDGRFWTVGGEWAKKYHNYISTVMVSLY